MIKAFKNKKGMTLMELIVGMIMFSIIAVSVSMALAPTLFAYMRANDFAEYNALLDNIANQIVGDLTLATKTPIFDEDTQTLTISTRGRMVTYQVNDGVLQRLREVRGDREDDDGEPLDDEFIYDDVFSRDFYKRKELEIELTLPNDPDANTFILTIRLTSTATMASTGQGFTIDREYLVRPLMLNQN